MPLYEYTCSKCRKDFELLVRGSQVPQCPECGNKKLTRQMSVPAAAHSADPVCPGAGEMCHQQPMPCCGAKGCRL